VKGSGCPVYSLTGSVDQAVDFMNCMKKLPKPDMERLKMPFLFSLGMVGFGWDPAWLGFRL